LSLSLLAACWTAAAQVPAPPVRVNQAGYLPTAPKVALFAGPATVTEFRVLDAATGKVSFTGKASPALTDPLSGDSVQTLDFSTLRKEGRFMVEAGGERSAPFAIAKDAYRRAYYLAARAFYGQRCGTDVDLGPEFPGYRYAACHQAGQYHESSGRSGPAPSVKGWHDAGDYDRYVVNSGITTGALLWAWELYRPKASLRIPESNDRTPDLLDEIRWNLEWMLTMQTSGGGVFHKQTTPRFSGFVMPAEDTMPSVVTGTGKPPYASTCASANFAAVMAIAGRVYEPYDPRYAAKLAEAQVEA
jgi:endoglucanase